MKNLVSIIIPVYNAERYIERCINSALMQTYDNIEIIAVNDGSVDDTQVILEKISQIDSRLIIISKENEGVSRARNDGLKASKGELIAFLDSDDFYKPNYIESMINKLRSDETCDVATLVTMSIKRNKLNHLDCLPSQDGLDYLCQMKMPTSVWAYVYKREVLKDIYFNPEIGFFEDFLFNYMVLSNTRNIALVYDDLYFYEKNPDGLNASKYNDKKLSSINIIDTLLDVKLKYQSKYLLSAYSYFIVTNLLFIAKSNQDCQQYYNIINKHSKKCIKSLNPLRIESSYYILTLLSAINSSFVVDLLKLLYYKNLNVKNMKK